MGIFVPLLMVGAAMVAVPAYATTARQALVDAAFTTTDKAVALTQIGRAEATNAAVLARAPSDREALMVRAMATGYRAKLERDRKDALEARRMFEILAAADPRDAEAAAAVGAWHIDAVTELGGMIAGAVLGANRAKGLAAMDRAVTLGGNRAMFPALAALLRLSLNPDDKRAQGLAEAATRGATPHPLDRLMQRSAVAVLVPLRAGNGRAAQALARQLLPFGRVAR